MPAAADMLCLDGLYPELPLIATRTEAMREPRLPTHALTTLLRQQLARRHRLPPDAITMVGQIDCLLDQLIHRSSRPVVTFPPSASAAVIAGLADGRVVPIVRGWGREEVIDAAVAADLPSSAVAWIESPSNPLGTLAAATDVVRLARSCRAVIVDERLADFAGRSMLPLVTEFENVFIVRALFGWPAMQPLGWWIAGSAQTAARIGIAESLPPEPVPVMLAALDSLDCGTAILRQVRAERSRLFRLVRKFSFLAPIPSWGPFLPARVELMPRARLVAALTEHGIRVHQPQDAGLEQFIRIGIGSRVATDRLQSALRAMAPVVLA